MALATSLTSASFISQRKAFQEFQPMAGVLPTPASVGNGRLCAPFCTSYVACREPLFTAVVGMAHSTAEGSQSRIVSPRTKAVRARPRASAVGGFGVRAYVCCLLVGFRCPLGAVQGSYELCLAAH